MKKYITNFFNYVLFIVLSISILTSCQTKKKSEQEYTISFYDDITLINQIKTAGYEEIKLPQAPFKEGLEFDGWYLDKNIWENKLTNDSFISKALEEDINAYAYYKEVAEPTPIEYTISFYVDDKIFDTIETAGNETLVLPIAPQKDNYSFLGWYFDNNSWTNKLYEDTYQNISLTENVNVYAYYKSIINPPMKFLVTFNSNQGTPVASMMTALIESEPITVRKGYRFMGWYKESNFMNKVTFPYEVTQDQTLYAKWEQNTYHVHFELNGGKGVNDMNTSQIKEEPIPTKEGFHFIGWYKESNFMNKVTFPYEVTQDQTLYAKWEQDIKDDIVFTVDENGVLTSVSGLEGSDIRVEIPSSINGIKIIEIGKELFLNNKNISTLIIPNSVKYLGYKMCYGCTNLKEVQLPNGITVIPDYAFENCTSLSTINFPDTLVQIRACAFSGTALESFTAPRSLLSIWDYAFKDCDVLKNVELTNVNSLGNSIFENCKMLESIQLPDTLQEIGDYAFSGCVSLNKIEMPNNPISISKSLFYETAYYNDSSNWENGILYVDGYLVVGNNDLSNYTECTIKEGTIVIANNAFQNVGKSLKKLVLPNGLYKIGKSAFSGLTSLVEINIPDTVQSIGYAAFENTGFYNDKTYWKENGLYVDKWLVSVENVAISSFIVQEGTIGVADGKDTSLFPRKAQTVENLTLPSSLKYIGTRSFARLKISELKLPKGLEVLKEGAFASCFNLVHMNLEECSNLKIIGQEAFIEAQLIEVTIPESVEIMGELVFNHNTVDLLIHCKVSKKPDGWDENWSYTYREGVKITVEWNI